MPEGTPYNSFIQPYPIRVDDFRDNLEQGSTVPALHLLSHTHSDHLPGLNAKSFGSIIVCSIEAKEMLLRYESWRARTNLENDVIAEKERTYSHLKSNIRMRVGEEIHVANRDLLRPIPLHTPTKYQLSNDEWVTITLVDANHCPGAVMFLVEGCHGAVLHTGDFRCEPAFINSLRKNPFLQRFIAQPDPFKEDAYIKPTETLDTVFIDAENLLANYRVLPKEQATAALIEIIRKLPSDRRFYINSWTWGYEDILKAIAQAFTCKIHVDRYKYEIYTHINDPTLASSITRDSESTRFHACERFDRCNYIRPDDPAVIYVNPAKMSVDRWEQYHAELTKEIDNGEISTSLLVPFSRHSPLPELQEFVRLFRPNRIVPNGLQPALYGLDWACMPSMFSSCLAEGGFERMQEDLRSSGILDNAFVGIDEDTVIEDPAMEYLMGNNAKGLVTRWASEPGFWFDGGRMQTRIRVMQAFLPKGLSLLVERAVRTSRMEKLAKEKPMLMESDDEYDSQSQDDGRGQTADFLFGRHWEASSVSDDTALSSPVEKMIREVSESPRGDLEVAVASVKDVVSCKVSSEEGDSVRFEGEASFLAIETGLCTPPPTVRPSKVASSPAPVRFKIRHSKDEQENSASTPDFGFLADASSPFKQDTSPFPSPPKTHPIPDAPLLPPTRPVKPPFLDLHNILRKTEGHTPSSVSQKRRRVTDTRSSPSIDRQTSRIDIVQRLTVSSPPRTDYIDERERLKANMSLPIMIDSSPIREARFAALSKSLSVDLGSTLLKQKRKHEVEREIIARKLLAARPDLDITQSFSISGIFGGR